MALLPKIKLKTLVSFPAAVFGGQGIAVRNVNGQYFFDLDFSQYPVVSSIPTPDQPNTNVLTYNIVSKAYLLAPYGGGGGSGVLPSTTVPLIESGAGAIGVSPNYARADHVHPAYGLTDAPSDGNLYGRKNAVWSPVVGGGRTVLAAATTYYVRVDGNDANNGLANTPSGAFLTIQKAIDTVASIDMSIYQATIQVGPGTYVGNLIFRTWLGTLRPIIQGDVATPSNVIISATSGHAVTCDGAPGWTLQGFRITTSGTAGNASALRADNGGRIYFQNIDFAATNDGQIWASGTAQINAMGNYSISGAAVTGNAAHFLIADNGYFACLAAVVVTIPAALNYSLAFAQVSRLGLLRVFNMTFGGAGYAGCTGTRYSVGSNSVVYGTAANANFFPGNAAGSVNTGGIYS